MIDTLVLLAAAAILPLLLLLFAFVGCEAREAGEVPEAWVTIGPDSFGNIERVDVRVRFDGEEHPHQNSFDGPIDQGDEMRFTGSGINAMEDGKVKSVKIICECELIPKIPVLDHIARTEPGDSIELRRFVLSGEESGFNLDAHADL
jgi:hypothetical protein